MRSQVAMLTLAVLTLSACAEPFSMKKEADNKPLVSTTSLVSETELEKAGCKFQQRSANAPIKLQCAKTTDFQSAYLQVQALEKYKAAAMAELSSPESAQPRPLIDRMELVGKTIPAQKKQVSAHLKAAGLTVENLPNLGASILQRAKDLFTKLTTVTPEMKKKFAEEAEKREREELLKQAEQESTEETAPVTPVQEETQAEVPAESQTEEQAEAPVEAPAEQPAPEEEVYGAQWKTQTPEFLMAAKNVEDVMATIDASEPTYGKPLSDITTAAMLLADAKFAAGLTDEAEASLAVATMVADGLKKDDIEPIVVEVMKVMSGKDLDTQKELDTIKYRNALLNVTRSIKTGDFKSKTAAIAEIIEYVSPSTSAKINENR